MKLLVGLGNPGAQYARQRHNIGFMVLDGIADAARLPAWRAKFHGLWSEGTIDGQKIFLLKPQTFMNRSGHAVAEAVRFYKIPLADIFVFHDELDLEPGKIRVKLDGGVAGHNGLRSIDQCLGSKAFARVRIGIGHPGSKDRVTGHVLGDFTADDRQWVETLISSISTHLGLLIHGRQSDFMSKITMETQKITR